MTDMRWRRRMLVSMAALAIVAGACGSGNNTGGGSPAASTGASLAPAESASPATGESPATGGSAEPSGSGAAPSGGTGAFQPPSQKVDLTLWNPFTGPDGNFFAKIVDKFNQETPNVQVKVATQPGAEYVQRLEAASSASQLPDVLAVTYDNLPLLTAEGIVTPLDDFVQQGGYSADMFPKAIWDAGMWQGQKTGIPIDTHPMLLFYNKKLFKDAGLDPEQPPTDTASFEAAIKAVQDKTDADGLQLVASGPGANFLTGLVWATLFYQGGGQWTNQDYTEAQINSDAGVQASTYLQHLANDLKLKKVESDAELNAFTQGKNAMMFNGIWQMSATSDALKEDLGVAEVPKFFGDGDWGGSHNLAVTANVANDPNKKAAAYYFIDWFSRNSLDWGGAGQVPARNDVRSQLEGKTEGLLPLVAKVAPIAEKVRFLPSIPGGGDILFVANGAGEAATLAINGSDPKTTLDKAAQFNTDVLKQNKERYGY